MPCADRLFPPVAVRSSTLAVAAAALLTGGGSAAAGAGYPPRPARPAAPAAAAPGASAAAKHRIVVGSPEPQTRRFRAIATVSGRPAVWIARRDGATLLRFDQRRTELVLHAGTLDPGPGYRHGPSIAGTERGRVLAAFNGGFRLNAASGGFLEAGRLARPLLPGFGSVVIYHDGRADIGAWDRGVPAPGRRVAAVRQNLELLVAGGRPAANVASCVEACWGASLGGGTSVARSGLGITAAGRLVWAAGPRLSPAGLARALVAGGAVRAIELDINPEWVAGYVYRHVAGQPLPQPAVPGQLGVVGRFLTPYSRDFFAVFAR